MHAGTRKRKKASLCSYDSYWHAVEPLSLPTRHPRLCSCADDKEEEEAGVVCRRLRGGCVSCVLVGVGSINLTREEKEKENNRKHTSNDGGVCVESQHQSNKARQAHTPCLSAQQACGSILFLDSQQEQQASPSIPKSPPSHLLPPFLTPTQAEGRMPPKYPVVDPAPTLDTVTANFGLGEYGVWFGMTALAVPLGHFAGT